MWPAQICPIVDGCAQYQKVQTSTITCPKFSHFTTHAVVEKSNNAVNSMPGKSMLRSPPTSKENILKKMQINKSLLTDHQLATLEQIHRDNMPVFDNDLTQGYNHHMGQYSVSFVFKDTSSPPPLKVWAPQYNRTCQELLYARYMEWNGIMSLDSSPLLLDGGHFLGYQETSLVRGLTQLLRIGHFCPYN